MNWTLVEMEKTRTRPDGFAAHIVGIDTSKAPVRLVESELYIDSGRTLVTPINTFTFDDLNAFSQYWTSWWEPVRPRVALPAASSDPLGIHKWLECNSSEIEAYPWMDYTDHISSAEMPGRLDKVYHRPYVLALYSGYRFNSAAVVRGLWAKMYELHDLFEELRQETHRLAAALPDEAREKVSLAEIPF